MKRSYAGVLGVLMLATAALAQQGLSLPAGTGMKMKLETPLSTRTSKVGDTFYGRVTEAVVVEGRTVVPVGAAVQGQVAKLSEPRRVRGTPEIVLRPDRLVMPNGNEYALSAVVVDTDKASRTTVDDEGKIHGRGRTGRDNAELVAGTGTGMVVGTIAGGVKGTFIGGGIGLAVTGAHWLTKKHSAELPAGSEITLELSRPMALTAAAAGQ